MSDTLDLGEEFMEHYGVKGMHWGIRNDKENISAISDEELRARVNRIRLETEYSRAKKSASSSAGLSFVKNNLGDMAKIVGSVATLTTTAIKVHRFLSPVTSAAKATILG